MKVVARFEDALNYIQEDPEALKLYAIHLTSYSIMGIEDAYWDKYLVGEELDEPDGTGPLTCRRVKSRNDDGDFYIPRVCFEEAT